MNDWAEADARYEREYWARERERLQEAAAKLRAGWETKKEDTVATKVNITVAPKPAEPTKQALSVFQTGDFLVCKSFDGLRPGKNVGIKTGESTITWLHGTVSRGLRGSEMYYVPTSVTVTAEVV